MLKANDIEEALIADFKKDAGFILYKYSHTISDLNGSANNWGGCFTALPPTISYNDVQDYLDGTVD